MKETKLNWFDRLMMNVTFAEANVESPLNTLGTKTTDGLQRNQSNDDLDNAQDYIAPAHS